MKPAGQRTTGGVGVLVAALGLLALPPSELLGREAPSEAMPRYKPPAGQPASARVAGGKSRGTSDEALSISVIAPDHTGLTTQSQPTLYWYASRPIQGRVEITIQDEKVVRPLVEAPLDVRGKAGLIPVPLAGLGVHLSPESEYRWSVSVIAPDGSRSRDVVTSAFIRRVGGHGSSAAAAAIGSKPQDVFRLAEEGLWYDALDTLGKAISQAPDDRVSRQQRAALLDQVGLSEIAEKERSAVP